MLIKTQCAAALPREYVRENSTYEPPENIAYPGVKQQTLIPFFPQTK